MTRTAAPDHCIVCHAELPSHLHYFCADTRCVERWCEHNDEEDQ